MKQPKVEPRPAKQSWCPILQKYNTHDERVAGHIIPHFMGFENVSWQMGGKGDVIAGFDHIWSLRNGIVVSKCFEERFDCGELVIVPIETVAGSPQRLKVRILSSDVMAEKVKEDPSKTYRDYDGKELVFKGTGRPGLRHLYWHYVTSVLRQLTYGDRQDITTRFPGVRMWASAGSYFRRSTLKPLAKAIGDYEVQPGDFEEGLFEGAEKMSEPLEVALATDTAHRLDSRGEDTGIEEDESEGAV